MKRNFNLKLGSIDKRLIYKEGKAIAQCKSPEDAMLIVKIFNNTAYLDAALELAILTLEDTGKHSSVIEELRRVILLLDNYLK